MAKRRYCTVIILTEIPGLNSKVLKSSLFSCRGRPGYIDTASINKVIKIKKKLNLKDVSFPQEGVGLCTYREKQTFLREDY